MSHCNLTAAVFRVHSGPHDLDARVREVGLTVAAAGRPRRHVLQVLPHRFGPGQVHGRLARIRADRGVDVPFVVLLTTAASLTHFK